MVLATFKLAASLDNLRISTVSVDVRRIVLSYNAVFDRATGWSNLIMFRSNNSGFDFSCPHCHYPPQVRPDAHHEYLPQLRLCSPFVILRLVRLCDIHVDIAVLACV